MILPYEILGWFYRILAILTLVGGIASLCAGARFNRWAYVVFAASFFIFAAGHVTSVLYPADPWPPQALREMAADLEKQADLIEAAELRQSGSAPEGLPALDPSSASEDENLVDSTGGFHSFIHISYYDWGPMMMQMLLLVALLMFIIKDWSQIHREQKAAGDSASGTPEP